MIHYSTLTQSALEAALLAGTFLKESFGHSHTTHNKEGKKNLVTECDLRSEEIILSFLHKKHPDHGYLSEEGGGNQNNYTDIQWIIDPLDGTVNFAYHIPVFTVSIAVCKGSEILSGVVFQPITNELFVAEKNKGAYLNGNKISVSKETCFEEAFLATGFPYHLQDNPGLCINTLNHFLRQGFPIRRLGSAALDLAYTAAGRFDAFWEVDLHPWDVAAGMLLVQEAGGAVSKYDGSIRSPLERTNLLASNSLLHHSMIKTIKDSYS